MQNFIRILMILILQKAIRRAAGWSPNALKIKTYINHMQTYCFPELAVSLKISNLWWNMMHALQTGFTFSSQNQLIYFETTD